MATHGRFLFNSTIKGMRQSGDLEIGVYGLFDTQKVKWEYFILSFYKNSSGDLFLTDDICNVPYAKAATQTSIRLSGKPCSTVEEGKQWIETFKMKWDSGSNNTTAEQRDKKIEDILNK